MFPEHVHKSFYFGALILLAVSLPLSVFILSAAEITLVVNWVLEGKLKQKWTIIKQRPSLWFIALFYLVHLLWLFNTSDFAWGFHDLKIKLPMLALPLVIGTSENISGKRLKIILNLYLGAVIVASIISSYFIFGFDGLSYHSTEEISPFVWHIRWSLMVVIAVFITFWLIKQVSSPIRWLYAGSILWLIFYLFILQVLTGIAVFLITSSILLIWLTFRSKLVLIKWFSVIAFFTLFLLTSTYISHSYARFFTFDRIEPEKFEKATVLGNSYSHDLQSKSVENGHYIYIYICEPELREAWQKRSVLNYEGKTEDGASLKYCLIRYLTSKGLRKDAEAVNQLSEREIKFIEQGKTNYIDTLKYSLYPRLYKSIWELYNYRNGSNPTGYSISQRVEFLITASHIIRNNFWLGVGTGDVCTAFSKQYEVDKTTLALENRLRTHNQLVTFFLTFGVFGFCLILFSLLVPPLLEKKFSSYLFIVIFTIGFLSFLNEDTLETQHGISFFAFFYFLFLFTDTSWKVNLFGKDVK
jgi:hypothetical protein